jgi:2-polyprenyl-3-methyl-5-hydroxy-6-metoxy-1,4-benzoquinol methylase
MTRMDETHVYRRDIHVEKRSSLSLLVGMIEPDSTVLDVGIGSGSLGAYLRDKKACQVDGITYNAEEAAVAGAAYREVKVADLDAVRVSDLFGSQRYRYIVCADVLEHLRDPALVLTSVRDMLEPGGKVLISVPNVAYLGLLGELLGGEFRYRHEGLLDQTHVRFFTRRSLLRFFADMGWRVKRVECVELDLADSEFAPALDAMPPAVRSQLLSNPDGLTYQFVAEVVPRSDEEQADGSEAEASLAQPLAHYALQMYYAGHDGFVEDRKIEARARIGTDRQEVVFPLPREAFAGLRLDPADRPGAMHLYDLELRDVAGSALWKWDGSVESLQHACQQAVVSPAWLSASGGALLFVGSDPHINLPIPESLLAQASGGELSVTLSWPMSADFRVLAEQAATAASRSAHDSDA